MGKPKRKDSSPLSSLKSDDYAWHVQSSESCMRRKNERKILLNLEDAKFKVELWQRDYNSHRPHSSLGYKSPQEFANSLADTECI